MVTCTRKVQFCAGHRVLGHQSKCRNMHGHNYIAWIHAVAPALNDLGMVTDFGVLKDVVGGWIDKNWDHGFIYHEKDYAVEVALVAFEAEEVESGGEQNGQVFARVPFHQKLFKMPYNPTAENMARYLVEISNKLLQRTGVEVTKVELWETENCFATYEVDYVPSKETV